MKKDINNMTMDFYKIILTIQESAIIFHKDYLSIQRHLREDLMLIIFFYFLLFAKYEDYADEYSIQETILSEEFIRRERQKTF